MAFPLVGMAVSALASSFASGIGQSLMSQLFSGVGSQILGNALQMLGEKMGLPQAIIDYAKEALGGGQSGAADVLKDALGKLSPGDASRVERDMNEISQKFADSMSSHSPGGEGGWLRALAKVLGEILNDKADKLQLQGKTLDQGNAGENAEFQAASKEFAMLMEGVINVVKTIGDGLNTAARK